MILKEKISGSYSRIYDGASFQDCIESMKSINIQNNEICVTIDPTETSYIKHFFRQLTKRDVDRLTQTERLTNKPPNYLKDHITKEKFESLIYDYHYLDELLPVQYCLTNNLLILFLFGERQTSRWVFSITSIWRISG